MSINVNVLSDTALEAAVAAAKGHAKDMKAYLEQRAIIFAEGAAALVKDRLSGAIDDSDVRFAWEEIQAAEESARLAIKVTAKAALQDAINGALAVVKGAVNQAVGIKLI
ncbi:MAG: hypothetical protein V4689_18595 [Verrucomicrobiota bacterium]